MSSQELAIYIRNEIESNTPKDKIIEHLKSAGWQDADIEKAFSEIDKIPAPLVSSAVFSDLRPKNRHSGNFHFGRWLGIFLVLIILAFAAFSITFNMGLMGPPQLLLDTRQNPPQNPEQNYAVAPAASSSATSSQSIPQNSTPPETASFPSAVVATSSESVPQNGSGQNYAATATSSSVASSSSISNQAPIPPATGISASDKDQIVAAILTQGTVLQSGNASNIRDYLEITASPAYLQQLQAMSDSDILSLASTLTANESDVTVSALNSPQATWQETSASSVLVTIQTPNGSVSRTANEVNSVWY